MKKSILIQLFLLVISSSLNAQSPTWQWAQSANSSSNIESLTNLVIDAEGNFYSIGSFNSDTIYFGSEHLIKSGSGDDFFIVKYDSLGNVLWAKSGGGNGNDFLFGLAIDVDGFINLSGVSIDSTITYDGVQYLSHGLFYMKIDESGSLIWIKTSTNDALAYPMVTSKCKTKGTFLGGSFFATYLNIDGFQLNTNNNYVDGFISKIDENGSVVYLKGISGTDYDEVMNITEGKNSEVYVTGVFNSDSLFYNDSLVLFSRSSNTNYLESFILKIDSLGNLLWAKTITESGNGAWIYSQTTDVEGNLLVSGANSANTYIDTMLIQNSGGYIAKFYEDGSFNWLKILGTATDLAIGKNILFDNQKNIIVSGAFTGPQLTIAGTTNFNQGSFDGFILKFDSLGNDIWVKTYGNTEEDRPYGLAIDNENNIILNGYFFSPSIQFDASSINNSNASGLNRDYFIAKITNLSVGIENLVINDENISIFPNPCKDKFNIKLPPAVERLNIYNSLGQKIFTEITNGKSYFEKFNLKSGTYYITLEIEEKTITKKLIVVN